MQVGASFAFQNPPGTSLTDADMYAAEVALADQVEGLGFDCLWGTEHHFTDYQLSPDVLQFLTYMAGRTSRVKLGSMAVVLPWHDPVRVAEQAALLDTLSAGRLILGIARGLGRVEFEGFRIPMSESRERFIECAEIVLNGLETGTVAYEGEYYQVPERAIRPRPEKSFRGRTYAAAVSPESAEIMARLGIGLVLLAQKPWETVAADLESYRAIFRKINGVEAPPTVAGNFIFCDKNSDRAHELGEQYISTYYHATLEHYELLSDHFKGSEGYEYYGKMADGFSNRGADSAATFFADLQVYGDPAECYDKIMKVRSIVGCETFTGFFSYAGMPYSMAEANMHLFAREVMPELQKVGVVEDELTGAGRTA